VRRAAIVGKEHKKDTGNVTFCKLVLMYEHDNRPVDGRSAEPLQAIGGRM
jgi:hypothetical protein